MKCISRFFSYKMLMENDYKPTVPVLFALMKIDFRFDTSFCLYLLLIVGLNFRVVNVRSQFHFLAAQLISY